MKRSLTETIEINGVNQTQNKRYGGGLLIFNSSATVTHNIFTDNWPPINIGSLQENSVEAGGAVFSYSGDGMDFTDFQFTPDLNNVRNEIETGVKAFLGMSVEE